MRIKGRSGPRAGSLPEEPLRPRPCAHPGHAIIVAAIAVASCFANLHLCVKLGAHWRLDSTGTDRIEQHVIRWRTLPSR
jgi:hypothetical protein